MVSIITLIMPYMLLAVCVHIPVADARRLHGRPRIAISPHLRVRREVEPRTSGTIAACGDTKLPMVVEHQHNNVEVYAIQ